MTGRPRLATTAAGLSLAIVIVARVAGSPGVVDASHLGEDVPDETSVDLSFVASSQPQLPDRVTARIVDYRARPIGSVEVEFRGEIEFLGTRYVQLGRAVTDATGTAQVPVKASHAVRRVEARFAGDGRYAPSSAFVDVPVPASAGPGPTTGFQPPRTAVELDRLASVMPALIAVAALGTWVTLVVLTLVTLRRIERGHPQASGKEP